MTASTWRALEPATAAGNLGGPAPVDPYLLWALNTRYASAEIHQTMAFLVEVDPAGMAMGDNRAGYDALTGAGAAAPYATAFDAVRIVFGKLPALVELAREGAIARFQLSVPRTRGTNQGLTPLDLPLRIDPELTTLGVIDDGCCIAHRALRDGDSSRFLCVWDQDQEVNVPVSTPWGVIRQGLRVAYGSELTTATINAALARWQDKRTDERAFYSGALSRPEWGRRGRTHGAGVVHIFTGRGGGRERGRRANDPEAPSATAPVIFVQLPRVTVADASGGSLGFYVLEGVRYIAERTRQSAAAGSDWKTTINISLGGIAGPHDGTSMTESALDELVAHYAGRVRLVVAAGNAAGRRIHARGIASAATPCVFRVLVPPAQADESYVEFWLPAGLEKHLRIEVKAPGGEPAVTVGIGEAAVLVNTNDRVIASVVFCAQVAQGKGRTMALLATCGTREDRGAAAAPYGIWTVTVHSEVDARIDAWVERNENIIGRRGGQRTRLVARPVGPARTAAELDDASTLGSIANGAHAVVVGGYTRSTARSAPDSSRGPVLGNDAMKKPQYMAASNDTTWLRGVRVPGFFSGQTTRMSGTSAAAPRVARMFADAGVSPKPPFVEVLDADAPGVD